MDILIEGENPVLDCDHDLLPSEWKASQIAVSFEDWLRKMFDRIIEHKSDPEYWFPNPQDNSLAEDAEFEKQLLNDGVNLSLRPLPPDWLSVNQIS
jgi:hypothetical protein